MVYVLVDGKYHDLLEGGVQTRCGLDVPYGSDYIPNGGEKPDSGLCADCFPDEKGKKKGK